MGVGGWCLLSHSNSSTQVQRVAIEDDILLSLYESMQLTQGGA